VSWITASFRLKLESRYDLRVATFHFSRAEAAKDFDGMSERVRNGDEVVIEENAATVAVMRAVQTAIVV
jgi:hypothetical protein